MPRTIASSQTATPTGVMVYKIEPRVRDKSQEAATGDR